MKKSGLLPVISSDIMMKEDMYVLCTVLPYSSVSNVWVLYCHQKLWYMRTFVCLVLAR